MIKFPRIITVPFRPIPLEVPEGFSPNEFFNSAENINDLINNNGILRNKDGLIMYRKAIGHSNIFDCSIIYNTSESIIDPLGRPVRRTQIPSVVKNNWNQMNQIIINFMNNEFPNPDRYIILAGEASLDATWPLSSPGVPSIRMIHNHFMVFDKEQLAGAEPANKNDPNLTDGGQHNLFSEYVKEPYLDFLSTLNLKLLRPITDDSAIIGLTGYPQGLPSWEVIEGTETIKNNDFWNEYDLILKGFIDFYDTFFGIVSNRSSGVPDNATFPKQIKKTLLFNNNFFAATKKVRDKCLRDSSFRSAMRWRPAFKQIIYRNDQGKFIVAISQNSIGNAVTELLGIVVDRTPNAIEYERTEPELMDKLLRLRGQLVKAGLGEAL